MKYMYDVSVHLLHLSSQLLNMEQRLLRQVQRLPRSPYFKYLPGTCSFDEFTVQNSTYT